MEREKAYISTSEDQKASSKDPVIPGGKIHKLIKAGGVHLKNVLQRYPLTGKTET